MPDLLAEAIRNPELADLLGGPLYWRLAVMHLPVDDDYCGQLADRVVAAVAGG